MLKCSTIKADSSNLVASKSKPHKSERGWSAVCIRMDRKNSSGRKKYSARNSSQIPYNDAKKAIECLIILAEIRHEMNQSGNGGNRIELYAENSLNGHKPIWKRICHFLCMQANHQMRFELKKLIQNFRQIDPEFRNTYDYYVEPNATTITREPIDPPKNAEAIQQEVISKVQLMQKYLESRANGDTNTPSVNLVQHLDDVINEFSKLIE